VKQEEDVVQKDLNIPAEIVDKAVQIQLAVELISTALEHNIMSQKQVSGGFRRLRGRMDDFKLDSPLIVKYYECIAAQFKHVIEEEMEQKGGDDDMPEIKQKVKKIGLCGGLGDREVDDLVTSACAAVKEAVTNKAKTDGVNVAVAEFVPIASKSQVVAGTNLFVKVRLGKGLFAHLRIWCKLDSTVELTDVQWGKKEGDEIQYF